MWQGRENKYVIHSSRRIIVNRNRSRYDMDISISSYKLEYTYDEYAQRCNLKDWSQQIMAHKLATYFYKAVLENS